MAHESRDSYAPYRAIFEDAAIGMALVDREGHPIETNAALEQMLGYDGDELRRMAFSEFTHPDDAEQDMSLFRELIAGGRNTYQVEKRYVCKDGRIVWGHLTVSAVRDAGGRESFAVGMVEDITERKRVQDELEKSNRRIITILESIGDAFFAVDREWRFTYLNSKAEKLIRDLTGTARPLLGARLWDLFPDMLASSGSSGKYPSQDVAYSEFFYPKLKRWFEVHSYPSEDGLSVYFRDISDRKAAAEELDRYRDQLEALVENRTRDLGAANERLEAEVAERRRAESAIREMNTQLLAANRELEAFSYSVSHDLRAPLRGIDGFGQALLEDYDDRFDERGRHYLQRIRAAAQRMGLLIDDLLNLSRVARSEMHWNRVDLSAMARSICADLHRTEPERAATFAIQDDLIASGDEALLRVMLQNLLGNAWKYTGKHARARIDFGAEKHEGELVYFVADDGAGFDMAYVEKLFAPFQRLHGVGEFEGTGIGLATVQRILARHGGRVWVEAAVERGATFYFTLARRG